MTQYCPKCGTARIGSLRFCRSCGYDLEAEGQPTNPSTASAAIRGDDRATLPAGSKPPAKTVFGAFREGWDRGRGGASRDKGRRGGAPAASDASIAPVGDVRPTDLPADASEVVTPAQNHPPVAPRRTASTGRTAVGCLVLLGIAVVLVHPFGLLGGGESSPSVSWAQVQTEIQSQYPDVTSLTIADGLLEVRVQGDWTDAGAVQLACGTVKPILAAHGVADQQFAIYNRFGNVIATGHRC